MRARDSRAGAAAVEAGADLVELGFPFSDPLADGPVIRRAAERALAQGMRTGACLDCLAATRERVDRPLVPMTHSSLLEAYGWDRFAADTEAAGATSLIVADLPAGELPRAATRPARRSDLHGRAAPSCGRARRTAGSISVTLTGTTGSRDTLSPALAGLVERARAVASCPLYAGFGISTPDHARAAAGLVDGIVVGSRAVEVAESGPEALGRYIATLRDALDA